MVIQNFFQMALNEQEIQTVMNSNGVVYENDLVVSWKFNAGNGDIAYDHCI